MSTVGQLIPLPAADKVPVKASGRVIALYPDSRQVWGHQIRRIPRPSAGQGAVYGPDAGLHEETVLGSRIDVYA